MIYVLDFNGFPDFFEMDDGAAPMLASMKTAISKKKEWFRIVQDYEYDPLGRLVAVKSAYRPELDESYVYDASGDIIEKTIAGVRSKFDYDLANQLKVSHVESETTCYRYDYRDRVIQLVRNDTAVKYQYIKSPKSRPWGNERSEVGESTAVRQRPSRHRRVQLSDHCHGG